MGVFLSGWGWSSEGPYPDSIIFLGVCLGSKAVAEVLCPGVHVRLVQRAEPFLPKEAVLTESRESRLRKVHF
jgi:hypothetical protein